MLKHIRKFVTTLTSDGKEVLDQTPIAVPVRFRKPPTHTEQMRDLIRQELSLRAMDQGHETFEEADDFDVGDDYDPTSPYEIHFDPDVDIAASPQFDQERPSDKQSGDTHPDSAESAHRAGKDVAEASPVPDAKPN